MRMGLSSTHPTPGGHPVDRLSAVLGQAVQFVYTCWDRIVLSGYIERLQRPENLIYFFRKVVGVDAVEPAMLGQRTRACKGWVRRGAAALGERQPDWGPALGCQGSGGGGGALAE